MPQGRSHPHVLLLHVYSAVLRMSMARIVDDNRQYANIAYIMYADDIVLLAPSGKGMQTIIDTTYAYGNAYDIIFNLTKSQVMFYDTLKIGEAG